MTFVTKSVALKVVSASGSAQLFLSCFFLIVHQYDSKDRQARCNAQPFTPSASFRRIVFADPSALRHNPADL